MPEIISEKKAFYRLGERLCLDFVNTVGFHASENPNEWINDYEKLVLWSYEAGALENEAMMAGLRKQANAFPSKSEEIYRQAIHLREAIYRIFSAIARNEAVLPGDMETLNHHLRRANEFLRIQCNSTNEFSYLFDTTSKELDSMVWPIVKSTSELLMSVEIKKLKQCESGTCGWLFIDTSRNRSRRWCSMEDCGNKEKARRHYRKKKPKSE